jgi:hypothetical protein
MILNCGRYERIGIRHRASQTLYLSGLIDPVNIQDLHYGKLHIGLHMAIVLRRTRASRTCRLFRNEHWYKTVCRQHGDLLRLSFASDRLVTSTIVKK